MATWKKVVVSGSSAELAALKVDNLTSGQVVIGGGSAGNLSTTAINGTGNIVATTGATNLVHSGSFSGSFVGSGAGLSGVAASFPVIEKTNIVTADKFFIQNSVGATSEFITYGNLLTDLAGTNLVTESNDSLTLASTITGLTSVSATGFTGSFTGSLIGALTGTASFANNATSASFASQAANATTASYVVTAQTASFVTTAQTASFITSSNVFGPNGANSILSSSYALTASFAQNGGTVANALTFGSGLSGSSATFNGGTAVTVSVSGAVSLTTNNLPKWTGTGFANSNISDTGTAISVSSNIPVTVNSNLTVTGDLTVAGTASFQNTQNLLIGDRFAALASGSTTLTDGGIIVVSSTTANGMSGSAFFLESLSSGLYGRWAVAANVNVSSSTVSADEYAVTAKISQASNPVDATPPTWGSSTNGMGNMWITNAGDIYIYS